MQLLDDNLYTEMSVWRMKRSMNLTPASYHLAAIRPVTATPDLSLSLSEQLL